jgi:hypothetical protein
MKRRLSGKTNVYLFDSIAFHELYNDFEYLCLGKACEQINVFLFFFANINVIIKHKRFSFIGHAV